MATSPLPPSVPLNISAYRVLYILLMLVRYRSLGMLELNRHLFENSMIGRGYNNETLAKYINTLREAGCEIPKASNRNDYSYTLLKSPFPLALNQEEIEVMGKLLSLLSRQADETLANDYREFLDHLDWSLDMSSWARVEKGPPTIFYELAHRRALLNKYRQYCQDAFHLRLDYRPHNARHAKLLYVEPQEVRQRENKIVLLALDCSSQESVVLDLNQIESVRQLPSKNKRSQPTLPATFALYGRLAKSYRLYTDEQISYQSDLELRIKAKVQDEDAFLNRLMKYGTACELLTPERLRDSMRERIASLLTCLEEPVCKHPGSN